MRARPGSGGLDVDLARKQARQKIVVQFYAFNAGLRVAEF